MDQSDAALLSAYKWIAVTRGRNLRYAAALAAWGDFAKLNFTRKEAQEY